jgi:hypothetical protein
MTQAAKMAALVLSRMYLTNAVMIRLIYPIERLFWTIVVGRRLPLAPLPPDNVRRNTVHCRQQAKALIQHSFRGLSRISTRKRGSRRLAESRSEQVALYLSESGEPEKR